MHSSAHSEVCLVTLGPVVGHVVHEVSAALQENFGFAVRPPRQWLLPWPAWNPQRFQYDAGQILRELEVFRPNDGSRMFAVTSADLFIPGLTFVFGNARVGGSVAVISVARLNPEDSETWDLQRVAARARKLALHEMGHSLHLPHCLGGCVMVLATTTAEIDRAPGEYCPHCRAKLDANFPAFRPAPLRAGA